MDSRIIRSLVAGLLFAIIGPGATMAQDASAADPLAEKAKELFEYEIGVWRSRWERLDAEGNVVMTFEGTESFSWYLDETVVELVTEIPELDQKSKALRFYSPREKQIVFWSVDQQADHWLMTQDVETEIVQSAPHPTSAGGDMIIRFTTLRKAPDAVDVVMHYSLDDGESWTKGAMQYLERADG